MNREVVEVIEEAKKVLNTSGYLFVQIVTVTPDEQSHRWVVRADVGVASKILKDLVIDDRTGKVVEYH